MVLEVYPSADEAAAGLLGLMHTQSMLRYNAAARHPIQTPRHPMIRRSGPCRGSTPDHSSNKNLSTIYSDRPHSCSAGGPSPNALLVTLLPACSADAMEGPQPPGMLPCASPIPIASLNQCIAHTRGVEPRASLGLKPWDWQFWVPTRGPPRPCRGPEAQGVGPAGGGRDLLGPPASTSERGDVFFQGKPHLPNLSMGGGSGQGIGVSGFGIAGGVVAAALHWDCEMTLTY